MSVFADRKSSPQDSAHGGRRGAAYMAVLEGGSASLEEASYRSSAVGVSSETSTSSIYRLDLSTGQLTEVEVEVPDEAVGAAAEQLAEAMLRGSGVLSDDRDRGLALDAAQAEMLRLATSLESAGDAQGDSQSEDEEVIEISSSSSDDSELLFY